MQRPFLILRILASLWGRHSCRQAGFQAGSLSCFLVLTAISSPALLAQSPADQPCRIEGQVLNAATNTPLKNATLRLDMSGWVPPGHTVKDPDAFDTSSDADGRFLFDAILSARYLL